MTARARARAYWRAMTPLDRWEVASHLFIAVAALTAVAAILWPVVAP